MKSNEKLKKIIREELTKSEVNSMIQNKLDSTVSSRDFESKVKEITASVINELFKTLWQRNSFWKNTVKN